MNTLAVNTTDLPIKRFIAQSGVSLIEVLVAIVIFSIGLLGAAGLQLASMRTSQYTAQSSLAVQAAQEYNDIISSTSVTATFTVSFDSSSAPSAPSTSCIGAAVTCTNQQMFSYSQYDWWKRLQIALPGSRIVVCQDTAVKDGSDQLVWACAPDGQVWVVKIAWASKESTTQGEVSNTGLGKPKFAMQIYGKGRLIGETS